MSTEHTITRKAVNGGLTIAQLREFLDEYDKAAGPDPLSPEVKARVAFGGGIKSITVTIPGGGGTE